MPYFFNIMAENPIFAEISQAVIDLDEEKAVSLAQQSIDKKLNILDVIEKGFGDSVRRLGDLWESGEFYLPELMMGGRIVQKAIDVLIPHLKSEDEVKVPGKVAMATIEGDVHSIGKTIVATMLAAYGYKVYDLGADVPVDKIIDEAVKNNVDIIGISALLTTTMVGQKKVIDRLKEKGLRDKFKVIIGGAPVNQDWAENCGADGYSENAIDAIKLVKGIMKN